jgi:tRNA nucleotidyltransferase (CCA-adding enzyme)
LALRLDGHHFGELHDYWGGLSDLRQGLVRVLHSLSFVDDPTRVLRAVRFEQRFSFHIEPRTLQLIHEAQQMITRVTGDRLRHELDHILDEPGVVDMLSRLHDLGLLYVIHADLTWDEWLKVRLGNLPFQFPEGDWDELISSSPEGSTWSGIRRLLIYCLWLMRLPETKLGSIFERLHFPRKEAETVRQAGELWQDLPALVNAKPSRIVLRLDSLPPVAIFACCLASDDPSACSMLKIYLSDWRVLRPGYTGDALRQKKLKPGPIYKEILDTLRSARLDGLIRDDEEETELFNRLLADALQRQVGP